MTATLDPSIVGQAEKTHNAVLYRALAGTTLDEPQWITMVLAIAAGGPVERTQHVAQVARTARYAPREVDIAIERLLSESLLSEEDGRLVVTGTGSALVERVRSTTSPIVTRAYSDIPDEDLATAGRVLTEITARLSAELDSVPGGGSTAGL
jgi:N-acetylglucosamine kinase-like BadF-type ATPase